MTINPSKKPSAIAGIPWWLGVLLAIASYYLLKHLAPDLAQKAGYPGVADFLTYLAPLVTIAFLLLAATLLYANDGEKPSPGESEPDSEGDSDHSDPKRNDP
jgi:hypothetical protein